MRHCRRLKTEAGQALVMVVLMMPVFFSVVALVTDGSTLLAQRRVMQNAADAAALAAAQDLAAAEACHGLTACIDALRIQVVADLNTYAQKNGAQSLNGGSGSDPAQCAASSDTNCYT